MSLELAGLAGLGRRTITGMLCTLGLQFQDWSAAYRMYSKGRFDLDRLFAPVRTGVWLETDRERPFIMAIDDTLLRKTGIHIPGVAWRRDPLGPPFQTNLVRAQRFVQISAALPAGAGAAPARMIPVDWHHAPTVHKPKANATEEQWKTYRAQKKQCTLSRVAMDRLAHVRHTLETSFEAAKKRRCWLVVDGGYTNGTVLKKLPENTALIGRIRYDAKLYGPPPKNPTGRKRGYGDRVPTPEQLRKDENVPYQEIPVWAAGKLHLFKVKTMENVRWRTAGQHHVLRIIVIAPLGYRPRKGRRLLYREPAYLVCTDPGAALADIIQAYVWRWDIEVNHRDEKQIAGVGEAQVRNPISVEHVPAFQTAGYAMLLLAGHQTYGPTGVPDALPAPKWDQNRSVPRASTQQLVQQLRAELWGKALGLNTFSGFVATTEPATKPEKLHPDAVSAVLYAKM